jgi:hypothetical protein
MKMPSRYKPTEEWLKEWNRTHGLGQTPRDIPYKHDLLKAGDELLRLAKINPRTSETEAEKKQRQKSNRRILANRQRRRAERQWGAENNRARYHSEMRVYESMRPEEPKS